MWLLLNAAYGSSREMDAKIRSTVSAARRVGDQAKLVDLFVANGCEVVALNRAYPAGYLSNLFVQKTGLKLPAPCWSGQKISWQTSGV
jgi:hypothetical protein